MTHPRTAIRVYAWDLIKEYADVGERVFLSRPNPIILEEFPCVNISFSTESAEVSEGDRYVPQQYERKLNLAVDIMAEQPNSITESERVEDELDEIARRIEKKLFNDIFFEKRIPGYDPNAETNPGLLAGLKLTTTTPYNVETGTERAIAAQRMDFELLYVDEAFEEHRMKIFEEYLMEIRRVGWDEHTTDPVLIAAEGEFNG